MQYVGQTGRALKKRFGEHYRRMNKPKKIDNFLYRHFKRRGHTPANILVHPVEKITYDANSTSRFKIIKRHETELKWIKLLQTPYPLGFNDNIYHEGNLSKMPDFDVFSLLEFCKRTARSHGIKKNGHCKRKSRVQKLANCTLRDLATKLDVHGRHCMLSYLSSLPISVLRSLDAGADGTGGLCGAALLAGCCTRHALCPVVGSGVGHIRHFIGVPFINKGMDFIDLPGIFGDESVQSSMPYYFKNYEVPIICYKYNKPIRDAIFGCNKLVSDLDIEACAPDFWACGGSGCFCPAAGRVVAGSLGVVSDSGIRSVVVGVLNVGFLCRWVFRNVAEGLLGLLVGFVVVGVGGGVLGVLL